MRRLIHPNRIPYGGAYVLDRPDLAIVGTGNTFDTLMVRVRQYRTANGHPNGLGLEDEVESLVCAKYCDECVDKDPTSLPKPASLRYRDIVTGSTVMASFISEGMPVVTQEEAERRVSTCAGCRFNTDFTRPCGGLCGTLKSLVMKIVGNRKTAKDAELKSCQICGCFLSASVWLPLELQLRPLKDHVLAQFEQVPGCWKKKSLL